MATGVVVAVVGDLHSNSTVGLCVPQFTLDDGGTYKSSPAQRWLWRNWLDYWEHIGMLKEETGFPAVAVIVGDAHDGDHHDTPQIITRNNNDQLRLAVEVIQPLLDTADKVFVIRGTESHSGKSGWREEALAEDIGAEKCPQGTASWNHLYANFGGVVYDIQHHPESGSIRSWTSGNGCNRMSSIIMEEYAATGDRIPDIAIRAHKHQYKTSGVHRYPFVISSPSWQFPTEFVKGPVAAAGKLPHFGGLYFICESGSWSDWDFIRYRPARSKPHRVEYD